MQPSQRSPKRRRRWRLPRPRRRPLRRRSPSNDRGERDGAGNFELVVAARLRVAIRPPPNELRAVSEAALLQLSERDFGDAFDAQRNPTEVLAGIPPTAAT